jgi:SAM-dependent methyltransferase
MESEPVPCDTPLLAGSEEETWLFLAGAHRTATTAQTSAEETIERFGTPAAAARYAVSLGGTATHRREIRTILSCLSELPRDAGVLDLPCGTGRLLPELAAAGYRVTEADSSPHMVAWAQQSAHESGLPMGGDQFAVASVFATGFADQAFDAVVCNRLLHHFRESEVRVSAIRELARISRGPIVASFFCNWAIDSGVFHLKQMIRGRPATDRIPIWRRVLAQDIRAAGLEPVRWVATRPGVSKQWYVVMNRIPG